VLPQGVRRTLRSRSQSRTPPPRDRWRTWESPFRISFASSLASFLPIQPLFAVGHRSSCNGPHDALPLLDERNKYPTAVSGLSVPEISPIRAPQHQRIARQSFFHVLGRDAVSADVRGVPSRVVGPVPLEALNPRGVSTARLYIVCIYIVNSHMPASRRTTYCPERMLHGTEKLLDRH